MAALAAARGIIAAPLAINAALEKALNNNPAVLRAEKEIEAAGADRYAAITAFLPAASIGGVYTRLDQEPPGINIDPSSVMMGEDIGIAFTPLMQYQFRDNYSGHFRVSQPVFTGGRIFHTARAAHSKLLIKEAVLQKKKSDIKVNVIKAFYGVIVAKETVKLSKEAVKQLERHLARVKKFKKAGMATEYDCLKTEVRLLSWKPKLARAEREFKNAKRNLSLLMGEEGKEGFEVNGSLEYEKVKFSLPNKDEAVKNALKNRPEIIMASLGKEAAGFMKMAAFSSMLPRVMLQYNYNYYNTTGDFSFEGGDYQQWWDVRVMLNWDIFSFGGNYAKAHSKAQKEGEKKVDLVSLKNSVKTEVKDAYEYLKEAEKAVKVRQKHIELAEKGYKIAAQKYKTGAITNTEFLDSHLTRSEARAKYLKALYEYKIAGAEFKRALAMKGGSE